jgi:hypothetical protein
MDHSSYLWSYQTFISACASFRASWAIFMQSDNFSRKKLHFCYLHEKSIGPLLTTLDTLTANHTLTQIDWSPKFVPAFHGKRIKCTSDSGPIISDCYIPTALSTVSWFHSIAPLTHWLQDNIRTTIFVGYVISHTPVLSIGSRNSANATISKKCSATTYLRPDTINY